MVVGREALQQEEHEGFHCGREDKGNHKNAKHHLKSKPPPVLGLQQREWMTSFLFTKLLLTSLVFLSPHYASRFSKLVKSRKGKGKAQKAGTKLLLDLVNRQWILLELESVKANAH